MPDRSRKRPRDLNELAASIVTDATSEEPAGAERVAQSETDTPTKNPAAVELGRLGGRKGGRARAAKLTPEERSAIAKRAAQARWGKRP